MRQFGYVITSSPEEKVEQDLFTCGHCQRIVTFKPGEMPEDAGGMCKRCTRLVCLACYNQRECDVFENKLGRMEAKIEFLRSVGLSN